MVFAVMRKRTVRKQYEASTYKKQVCDVPLTRPYGSAEPACEECDEQRYQDCNMVFRKVFLEPARHRGSRKSARR